MVVQRRLSERGILFRSVEAVNDSMYAAEFHGMTDVDNEPLRVSIVEDIYADMFPVKTIDGICTETVEGLYHRKLRTIAGSGAGKISLTGDVLPAGGRQTIQYIYLVQGLLHAWV